MNRTKIVCCIDYISDLNDFKIIHSDFLDIYFVDIHIILHSYFVSAGLVKLSNPNIDFKSKRSY